MTCSWCFNKFNSLLNFEEASCVPWACGNMVFVTAVCLCSLYSPEILCVAQQRIAFIGFVAVPGWLLVTVGILSLQMGNGSRVS